MENKQILNNNYILISTHICRTKTSHLDVPALWFRCWGFNMNQTTDLMMY